MDTSKTYIRMCEKAEEIQKLREDNIYYEQDYTAEYYGDNQFGVPYHQQNMSVIASPRTPIWLPRQDQLQAMLKAEMGLWVMLDRICQFQKGFFAKPNTEERYEPDAESMEQLWLAFAMFELYQKVWDNEKERWVKIES